MDGVLWYVLAGTSGGYNRLRLLRTLRERPRNANKLAATLSLDYTTVRHHLSVLVEHDLVTKTGGSYGAIYRVPPAVIDQWDVVEKIDDSQAESPATH